MKRMPVPTMLLGAWGVLAILAPWLNLHPNQIDLDHILTPPTLFAPLGYDDLGRSLWDRLIFGARTSLLVAVAVVTLSGTLGIGIGVSSAYLGGAWDRLANWLIDVVLAFPGILLAIALAGILGPGLENVVIALCSVGWVGYARLARGQVLTLIHRDHVLAAQALGAGRLRIMTRHLLPLLAAPLIVEASFNVAAVVLAEAGLSFLGMGIQAPAASWGSMIRDGTRYMLVAPHMVLAPGLSLLLIVLAINLLGDRLRDRLDVRGR